MKKQIEIQQKNKDFETNINKLISDNEKLNSDNEELSKKIISQKNILKDSDLFELEFYKNNDYLGLDITLNKFDKINNKSNNMKINNGVNNDKAIDNAMDALNQNFRPVIIDKKLTRFEKISKDLKKNKFNLEYNIEFDKKINKRVFKKHKKYRITVTLGFRKGVGVYDYTNDNFIKDGFILNYYKIKEGTFVRIPYGKFILKKE